LLAHHESAEQELDIEYCRTRNITIQRRITGGGALYTDESQLGWELYLHRRDTGSADMLAIAKRVCHAAAAAISTLGVDARFRPHHDIEVDGRKIMDGGGVFEGNALLYHGTLRIDLDVGEVLRVLRVPVGKLSGARIEFARERLASMRDLLGYRAAPALIKSGLMEAFESEFDAEFQEADLTLTEHARFGTAFAEIDTPGWIGMVKKPVSDTPVYEATHDVPGGVLRASLIYDRPRHRIRQIWFSGDINAGPRRTVADLEAALRDTSVERLEHNVRVFFAGHRISMTSLTPEDFIAVTRLAAKQPIVIPSRT
jgi:lipoate-protein ligase A